MFPHLVAGPIVRWTDIGVQLKELSFNAKLFNYGALRVATGVAKKVLIADQLAVTADQLFGLEQISSTSTAWLAMVLYSLQIYLDFSAYSDIAIGIAAMLGIKFHENFDYPYRSRSASEFWRRWHISLGSWFRDYVYIPMGGSRVSRKVLLRNMLVVWFLTGLWHGAAWNFIVWGLYFGFLIVLERGLLGRFLQNCPRFLQHVYGLLIAGIGWILFRSETLSQAQSIISSLIPRPGTPLTDNWSAYVWQQNRAHLAIAFLISSGLISRFLLPGNVVDAENETRVNLGKNVLRILFILALMIVSLSYMLATTYQPFIYFRF
jgi:alginate O-acetyltransferase complex protein AlgI